MLKPPKAQPLKIDLVIINQYITLIYALSNGIIICAYFWEAFISVNK